MQAPGIAPGVRAWDARPLADSCQFAGRVQSALRFQVASELQRLLDRALPGLQVPAALLACIALQCAVRAGASSLVLLRDTAFIQLGQCIMAASGDVEQHPGAASTLATASTVFLLRTLLLCLPPLALGICAGLGIRATVADYVQGAITAYQYKYAADAGAFLQTWAVGTTPVLLGIAALRVSTGAQMAARGKSTPRPGPDAPQEHPAVFSGVYLSLHLILVDFLLYDLKHTHATAPIQLALSVLALVAMDAVMAVLDYEPESVQTTLHQIRGFALWRVSQQLIQRELKDVDVLVASCGATLLLVCRTALDLGQPSAADSHPSLVNTLSELGFMSGVQILLQPSTSNTSTNLAQHLLRVMYIATAAGYVEKALSGKCA
jgi:hypothetical protein